MARPPSIWPMPRPQVGQPISSYVREPASPGVVSCIASTDIDETEGCLAGRFVGEISTDAPAAPIVPGQFCTPKDNQPPLCTLHLQTLLSSKGLTRTLNMRYLAAAIRRDRPCTENRIVGSKSTRSVDQENGGQSVSPQLFMKGPVRAKDTQHDIRSIFTWGSSWGGLEGLV